MNRRSFLGMLGLGAAVAATFKITPKPKPMIFSYNRAPRGLAYLIDSKGYHPIYAEPFPGMNGAVLDLSHTQLTPAMVMQLKAAMHQSRPL